MSCASAGSCAAGGCYTEPRSSRGSWSASRTAAGAGRSRCPAWRPWTRARSAGVVSVSCGSAGNCAAGGYYLDRHSHIAGVRGHRAERRLGPGDRGARPGRPEHGRGAGVISVSCASAGSCAAGGYYRRPPRDEQGFVAAERNGVWGGDRGARPGGAEHGRGRQVGSVSCASAGNCAAGGYYTATAVMPRGSWPASGTAAGARAIEVPGLAALNKGGDAGVDSVSCASAGNCAAGGYYDGAVTVPGVRGRREERRLGQGDRGARPGGPEQGR